MRLVKVKRPEEVYRIIKDKFTCLETEIVDLWYSGGRIIGSDILAPEDVPGFDRSIVDGYALRAADTFGAGDAIPAMLNLAGEIRMGEAAQPLPADSCLAIPTGGMLPPESDSVIMSEYTEALGTLISCYRQVAPGENVIRRGEDISKGDCVLRKGKKIRAPELGVLASLGIGRICVYRKPRVAILSTGNEVVSYTTKSLAPGQIRDSNALAVGHLSEECNAEVIYGGILPDTYEDFKEGISELLKQVDFLVLSGGSSVGARDFSERVLRELEDGELLVEGLAVQPGKPTLLACCQGKPVLGLPGHPVSAVNIFALFGRYIIQVLQGGHFEESFYPTVKARLLHNVPSVIGRTDFVRVKLLKDQEGIKAEPLFGRSGLLRTLSEAHGLIRIPEGSEGLSAGAEAEVMIWE